MDLPEKNARLQAAKCAAIAATLREDYPHREGALEHASQLDELAARYAWTADAEGALTAVSAHAP